ncbi:hypothetical protein [Lentzea albidocapillata]|uniref:hypothetical protein n=1 Tax=Lentzea albidocapillata TaxID=40571 RepID=UPI00116008AC|nr:hypothetical protein [Lentzea albidocapillata]
MELSAYETPELPTMGCCARRLPSTEMVDGPLGAIGSVASIGGIVVALLTIQPWLVRLMFA